MYNKYDETESKERLINTLEYLIERDHAFDDKDIDEKIYDYITSECSDFYVIINDVLYRINADTACENAKVILDNIDSIQYKLDVMRSFDSVVGDIDEFLISIGKSDFITYHYIKAVREIGKCFTKEDIKNTFNKMFME
jgi:hypothetical protein